MTLEEFQDKSSVSPTSGGKFTAWDGIRNERLYVKGKGATIRYFDSEAEARTALAKVYKERHASKWL